MPLIQLSVGNKAGEIQCLCSAGQGIAQLRKALTFIAYWILFQPLARMTVVGKLQHLFRNGLLSSHGADLEEQDIKAKTHLPECWAHHCLGSWLCSKLAHFAGVITFPVPCQVWMLQRSWWWLSGIPPVCLSSGSRGCVLTRALELLPTPELALQSCPCCIPRQKGAAGDGRGWMCRWDCHSLLIWKDVWMGLGEAEGAALTVSFPSPLACRWRSPSRTWTAATWGSPSATDLPRTVSASASPWEFLAVPESPEAGMPFPMQSWLLSSLLVQD